ncbi:MAG: hypothetical protein HC834_10170 [Rhodospirillales bacterium]|nr:hypothetical protein [Rhodospirillales bacterium]
MQFVTSYFPAALSAITSTAGTEVMVAKKKQRVDGRLPDAEDQGHASHGQSPNCQQTTADGSTDPAFDRWLRTKLETLYGSVVDEPIPDEMLKIIADFQKQKKDEDL